MNTQGIVDGRGRIVGSRAAGGQRLKASSELPMHLEAYRLRPDIQAIVHAHPPITVALSIAGISVERCLLPETIVSLGLIPTASYATPASEENVSAIRDLIVDHDAIVLERHGSLTVGDSLQQAFMRLESVEQNARIAFMLAQLGVDNPLEPAQVGKLLQQRKDLGLSHAGDETRFCRQCGLPLEAQCGHEETAVESQQLRELVTKIVTKNLKVD